MKALTSVLVSCLALGSLAGVAVGAGRMLAPASDDASFESDLAKFQSSLNARQVDALSQTARSWDQLSLLSPDQQLEQLEADMARVLTPRQQDQFAQLINPTITAGGHYFPQLCLVSSQVGLAFSVLGMVGCPGTTSKDATKDAYAATSYASVCSIESSSSCENAVASAAASYLAWSQLMGTCDLADSAAGSEGAAYYFCGGVY